MSEFEGFGETDEDVTARSAATPESKDVGIEYVEEDGSPESLPDVMMASDLLPPEDDPLASLPSEPPDDDTPPDEAAPAFIVTPATAAKRESVRLADGTPVGVWLNEEHHDLDGGQVAELLITMGLDGKLAAWFGIQRDKRREADRQLASDPMVKQAVAQDAVRTKQKAAVTEAFIKAQKAKK